MGDGEGGSEVYSVAPLSLNTQVPTIDGFKKLSDIQIGDMVFNPKGEPVEVDYISPIVNYDTYKIIFEDGTEVIATANHLWTVEEKSSNGKGKSQIYKTKTVETKDIKIKYGGSYATKIKLSEPLQFEEKQLPIDPYTLGAWLGDGRSNRGNICTHFEDHEIWENIEKNGYKLSFQNNKIETIKYYTVLGARPAA